jgi:FKBP-type peptidyl-prolyl cis-trans isomerase FkpA
MKTPQLVVSLLFVFTLAAIVSACGNDSSSSPTSPSQNLSVPYTQTDLTVGAGTEATNGRRVTVNYTLWLYDASRPDNKGTQIQTTVGAAPYAFTLGTGAVIRGWDQGVPGMRVGGVRRLIIPPNLAYGSNGSGQIPPNATIVFDIELLSVS